MSRVIKVGVVGCGGIAQIMHLPYLNDLENFEISAISDFSRNLLEKVGEKYHVPAGSRYSDFNEMIESADLDAVLVCNKDHYPPVMKAAQCGKHVFVEKPFGFNVKEGEAMIAACEKAGVKLLVGYMKRYDPCYEYASQKIKEIGEVDLARFHDFSGSFDYMDEIFDLYGRDDVPEEVMRRGKQAEREAMMAELGEGREALLPAYFNYIYGLVHDTVLLRDLFGDEGKVLYADVFHGCNMSVILQYGDVRCTLEVGFSGKMPIWDEDISVYSRERNVQVKFPFPYLKNAPTEVYITEDGEDGANYTKKVTSSFDEAYRREWLHFYDCIVHDKTPLTSGRDGMLDIQLAGEIMRAVNLA